MDTPSMLIADGLSLPVVATVEVLLIMAAVAALAWVAVAGPRCSGSA